MARRPTGSVVRCVQVKRPGASRVIVPLCGMLVVALVLRLHGLGARSLWYDEIMSAQWAHLDWYSFLKKITNREANMVLYYCILRIWVHMGDGEAVIRGLSVVFSLLTIPVVYALGARLFGRRAGFFAALLMSLNAFDIRYAQEARSYSLLVLLVSLASLYWVKAVDGSSDEGWRRYIAVAGASVYAHFFAGLVVLAHGLSLAVYRPRPLPWRRLRRTAGMLACVVLPAAIFAVARDKGQLDWIEPAPLSAIWTLLTHLSGGTTLIAGMYALLCLYALGTAWLPRLVAARRPDQQPGSWHLSLVLVWLCAPIALTWTVSLCKPLFLDRYLIICLPALVLLAAVGLSSITSRAGLAVALIGIAIGAAQSLTHYYRDGMPGSEAEDWRGVTRDVISNARASDAILLYPDWIQAAFPYYQPKIREAGTPNMLSSRAWSGGDAATAVAGLTRHYENVWVILHDASVRSARYAAEWRQIQQALGKSYSESRRHDYTGLEVIQFTGRK